MLTAAPRPPSRRDAEIAGQVPLDGRPDGGREIVNAGLSDRRQRQHQPGEGEPEHLGRHHRDPELRFGAAARLSQASHPRQRAEDRVSDELPEHHGRLLARHRGPQQAGERLVELLGFPQAECGADHALPQPGAWPRDAATGQGGGQRLAGHQRQPHRRGEQRLLGAVEVMHERRVHLGDGGDGPDRRAVIAALGEQRPGGVGDRFPGAALPGPPTTAPWPPAARDRLAGPATGIGLAGADGSARTGRTGRTGPTWDGHAGTSVADRRWVSSKNRSSRVAGACRTVARMSPSARRTSSGSAPGTRRPRPARATWSPAASSALKAADQDSASTTAAWAEPMIWAAVPSATTAPSAITTSLPHSAASSM